MMIGLVPLGLLVVATLMFRYPFGREGRDRQTRFTVLPGFDPHGLIPIRRASGRDGKAQPRNPGS